MDLSPQGPFAQTCRTNPCVFSGTGARRNSLLPNATSPQSGGFPIRFKRYDRGGGRPSSAPDPRVWASRGPTVEFVSEQGDETYGVSLRVLIPIRLFDRTQEPARNSRFSPLRAEECAVDRARATIGAPLQPQSVRVPPGLEPGCGPALSTLRSPGRGVPGQDLPRAGTPLVRRLQMVRWHARLPGARAGKARRPRDTEWVPGWKLECRKGSSGTSGASWSSPRGMVRVLASLLDAAVEIAHRVIPDHISAASPRGAEV